jgi:hypothetical protein
MGIAIGIVKKRGLDEWIGSGLGMLPSKDRENYAGVLDRGIKEIGAFLRKAGVK